MNLLEILNTNLPIKWSIKNGFQHEGVFKLDDVEYVIQADEYEVNSLTILDIGFNRENSIVAVNSDKSSAKIIGAVFNGISPIILSIDPDVILLSVQKSSGLVESRKSLYESIIKWVMRRTSFTYCSNWIENSVGFYKVISKKNLTDEQMELFISSVKVK